jgi:4-amino-4-deoxy-L-arabinose transferase-like glycosyltransferase
VTFVETSTSSRRLAWAAVLALLLAIYLGSAFSPALQDDVDSSHAEVAREMITRGDYVTLHVNGVRYLEKAPMMYWLVAGSYRLFGPNEFATRLPTLLAMSLLVVLGMYWGSRAFGQRAGLYAGLFMATGVGCYLFTRILIPEAILSLLIATAFFCLVSALDRPNSSLYWYAGYVLLALAVLTKGLMAMVVIGIPLVAYIAISGEWRRWREFRLCTGLLLFFVIAAPWHILAGIASPPVGDHHHGFYWFYFVNEQFLRFLGKRVPHDYNKLPGPLYWSLHLVWLFPWSLYLPLAIRRIVADLRNARREQRLLDFRSRTRLICILWASVTLLFFSFSTNQEYYTFPSYLAFFLLLGAAVAGEELDGEQTRERKPWLLATSALSVTVRIAFAIVLIAGLWSSRHLPFVPDIGEVLVKSSLDDHTLSMDAILNLTGQSFAALRFPAILAVIALLFGSLTELILRIKRKHFASTWALAATMTVFLLAAHVALIRFDPYLGSRVLVTSIEQHLQPQDRVIIYGDQGYGSSLLFYLRRPIEVANGANTTLWFGSTFPDAPHILLDSEGLKTAWDSPQTVYLFVPQHERAKVEALLHPSNILAQRSGKVIFTNHPVEGEQALKRSE